MLRRNSDSQAAMLPKFETNPRFEDGYGTNDAIVFREPSGRKQIFWETVGRLAWAAAGDDWAGPVGVEGAGNHKLIPCRVLCAAGFGGCRP